jgi:hypothetical protein
MQLTLKDRIRLAEEIRNERAVEMLREADRKLEMEIVSFRCRCKSCDAKRAWYALQQRTVECERRKRLRNATWLAFVTTAIIFAALTILYR